MRLSTSFLLGAAMITSALYAAVPQAATPSVIAVINGDRVLEGSNIGRQAREQLEAEAATWQERITELTAEVDTLRQQRQEQALTLNEAALTRMNEDIEEKQVRLERLNDDARRELQRLEQQITLDVNTQLGPLVERFAVDRGLDLILDSARMQGVLYYNTGRDLTDDFLAMVNSVNPTSEEQQ